MDGPTPMHIWPALNGFSGLPNKLKKNNSNTEFGGGMLERIGWNLEGEVEQVQSYFVISMCQIIIKNIKRKTKVFNWF